MTPIAKASLGLVLLGVVSLRLPAQVAAAEQDSNVARASRTRDEFPLRLKSKIIAGKTAVGSPVEGTLVMATLVNGVVVPEGAVFSGAVEESIEHKDKTASRLRVHITEARWKEHALHVSLYASGHIYPPYKQKTDPMEARHLRRMLQLGVAESTQPDAPNAPPFDPRQLIDREVRNERSTDGVIVITSAKNTIELGGGGVYCFEGSTEKPAN
jgi:hypothetical protein